MLSEYDMMNDLLADLEEIKPKDKLIVSPKKIIVALIGGAIGSIIDAILIKILLESLWNPLVIAICFLVLALCIYLPLLITSNALGDYARLKKKNVRIFRIGSIVTFIAIFVFGMLFEFLYELHTEESVTPTSYIFALDTSGSMESTDATHKMEDAVEQMVDNMDDGTPFAVYTFNDNVTMKSNLHEKTAADEKVNWHFSYTNGTCLYTALNQIQQDCKENADIVGKAPRILLISDGVPTDGDFYSSRLQGKSCRKNGISICTISVSGADEKLMEEIAINSGGCHFKIDDMNALEQIFTNAMFVETHTEYTLLTHRPYITGEGLYVFLHILFLLLLGVMFFGVLYFANGIEQDASLVMVCKGASAILMAVLMEVLSQIVNLPDIPLIILFSVCTAFSILRTYQKKYTQKKHTQIFTDDMIASTNLSSPDMIDGSSGVGEAKRLI